MKPIGLLLLFSLTACSDLTPKQLLAIGAGVLLVGYQTSREMSNGNHHSANTVTIQPVNCQATSCQ